MKVKLRLDGRVHEVELTEEGATVDGVPFPLQVSKQGNQTTIKTDTTLHTVGRATGHEVVVDGQALRFELLELHGVQGVGGGGGGHGPIKPPMNGKLVELHVQAGEQVSAGQVLFVLEAMKMRNEIKAAGDGVVSEVRASEGDAVDPGTVILVLSPQ